MVMLFPTLHLCRHTGQIIKDSPTFIAPLLGACACLSSFVTVFYHGNQIQIPSPQWTSAFHNFSHVYLRHCSLSICKNTTQYSLYVSKKIIFRLHKSSPTATYGHQTGSDNSSNMVSIGKLAIIPKDVYFSRATQCI